MCPATRPGLCHSEGNRTERRSPGYLAGLPEAVRLLGSGAAVLVYGLG